MNTKNNEELHTDNPLSPGEMLRQGREQLGYSQDDIASRLRLRLSVIDDIENNIFDEDQLATFTRGYVRSYAKYVNLDEAAVVALLDKYDHVKPKAQAMQSFSRRTKREAHDSRVMGLTWILAAIFVGVTAVWWWQNIHLEQNSTPIQDVTTVSESVVSEPTKPEVITPAVESVTPEEPIPVKLPTASVISNTVTATTNTTAEQTNTILVPAVVTPVLATEDTTTPSVESPVVVNDEPVTPPVIEPSPALQLTFSADCWVDIRDAKGKRLESGIKKAGQILDIDGNAPFRVRLGVPSAVKIEVKGQPFDLSRYPKSRPITLTLPQ